VQLGEALPEDLRVDLHLAHRSEAFALRALSCRAESQAPTAGWEGSSWALPGLLRSVPHHPSAFKNAGGASALLGAVAGGGGEGGREEGLKYRRTAQHKFFETDVHTDRSAERAQ
jgi:hypothetical protein